MGKTGIYSGMTPMGRNIAVISVIAIITIAGVTAYKLIKKGQNDKKDQNNEDEINSVSDSGLQALATQGIYPTFLSEQYLEWADILSECFQGYGTCDNYFEVFRQLKNDADWLRLVQAYGIRTINSGKWNFLQDDVKLSLGAALHSELSASDLDAINQQFSKKGMKKRA